MAHLPTGHCVPGAAPGTRTGRPGTRPLTANFRRTGEFALESCSSVKAPRLGGSVEWRMATAAAACQIILFTPVLAHARRTRRPLSSFFSDGPPPRNTQHILIRPGRVEGAKRGNKKLENLKLPRVVRSRRRLHAAGIPRASLVWPEPRSGKRRPVVRNDLTHFIDDQVEALVSIRER